MIMFLIIMVCSSILFYIMRDKDQAKLNHERRLERRLERKRRRATAKGVDA
jgi:multiple sugar transport system permease protein